MTSSQALGHIRQYRLMSIFNYYRLVLSVFLLVYLQVLRLSESISEVFAQDAFMVGIGSYLILTAVAMVINHRNELNQATLLAIMLTDIVLLTVIVVSAGGVESGFANLMVVSVATGSLFLSVNNSLLLSAFACSAIIYTELFFSFGQRENHYQQAALLGVAFFGTTVLIQYILVRVKISEQIAEERAVDIEDLMSLNEQVVERMRTGIIVCSRIGEIKTFNAAAQRLICNQGTNLTNMEFLPDPVQRLLEKWINNEFIDNHIVRIHKDMPDVFVNFTMLMERSDSDVLVFLEDISQTNQQAQQMKLASLGRFTASIAHEIRNPLGAISHAAQLMEESPALDKGDHRLLEIIRNHSARMNEIIENILQLSRRSKSQPEVINLNGWLREFISEYSQVNPNGQLSLSVKHSVRIRFDPSHLHQVISNLVNNGIRYSMQHTGQPKVSIKGGILNANLQPYLDIIDFGPGITGDVRSHLFEPFFTTESSGTGLGLFISKELCESNQSRLDLIDSDQGAKFRITFSHPARLSLMD